MNLPENHFDNSENNQKSPVLKKMFSCISYGGLSFFVFGPPVIATLVALRFQGMLLWISSETLLDMYMLTAFMSLLLVLLAFPIFSWAICERKPLPIIVIIASLIYSGIIILRYSWAIT